MRDHSCFPWLVLAAAAAVALSCPAADVISTVAGTGEYGFSGDGGPATTAQLSAPGHAVVDAAGNLFISDGLNYRIRKVDAATGVISTIAGDGQSADAGDGGPATAASFMYPRGLALDSAGNILVADVGAKRIRRIDAATAIISTLAGDGTAATTGDGGPATAAALNDPTGVAADSAGNVYVAEFTGNRVRKVDAATGIISTVAGTGEGGYGGDGGPATAALLQRPVHVTVDAAGNVFISDQWNHRVRKVTAATGVITTVAGGDQWGYAGDGGPATNAALHSPCGIAVDAAGSVYVVEMSGQRVRRVDPQGVISTVAGTGQRGSAGDGGPPYAALFATPDGLTLAGGCAYVAEWNNHRVRKFTVSDAPAITTPLNATGMVGVALNVPVSATGNPYPTLSAAGLPPGLTLSAGALTGTPTAAGTYDVTLTASNGAGPDDVKTLKVVIEAPWVVTTVAGNGRTGYSGDGGPATQASLYRPGGLALDASGGLYIADTLNHRVRKVAASTGTITTVAGTGTRGTTGDGGPATDALLSYPGNLALDAGGNLFFCDMGSNRVRKVDAATGIISTYAGDGFLDENDKGRFAGDGGAATAASLNTSKLFHCGGVAFSPAGNLFIGDSVNHRIRRVDTATGIITTHTGDGYTDEDGNGRMAGDGSTRTYASLNFPRGITWDAAGNCYIADTGNNRIRRVDSATGRVSTLAGGNGAAWPAAGDGGLAVSTWIRAPYSVAIDKNGCVLFADNSNGKIRKVDPVTGIVSLVAEGGSYGATFGLYTDDGVPASHAQINFPLGLIVDPTGAIYYADRQNDRIRKLAPGTPGNTHDTDGDGFSDELEELCGTSPTLGSVTPLTGLPAWTSGSYPTTMSLTLKLNFSKPDSDSLALSAWLPVSSGHTASGQQVLVDVGGCGAAFKLDSRGGAKVKRGAATHTCKLAPKAKDGKAKLSIKLTKAALAPAFADEGYVDSAAAAGSRYVRVAVFLGSTLYKRTVLPAYSAKLSQSGNSRYKPPKQQTETQTGGGGGAPTDEGLPGRGQ